MWIVGGPVGEGAFPFVVAPVVQNEILELQSGLSVPPHAQSRLVV